MLRPLWLESSTGEKLYVAAEKDGEGWIVRLHGQNGSRKSRIVYRVDFQNPPDELIGEVPAKIVSDLMREMRRQVMTREIVLLDPNAG